MRFPRRKKNQLPIPFINHIEGKRTWTSKPIHDKDDQTRNLHGWSPITLTPLTAILLCPVSRLSVNALLHVYALFSFSSTHVHRTEQMYLMNNRPLKLGRIHFLILYEQISIYFFCLFFTKHTSNVFIIILDILSQANTYNYFISIYSHVQYYVSKMNAQGIPGIVCNDFSII